MGKLTAKQAEAKFLEYCEQMGLEVEVKYVGKQANVPGIEFTGGSPDKLTIHETANENPLADARMHRQFVANGGGQYRVSFTASVDWQRLVLILPLTWANYGQGTDVGNFDSLSIEVCVNVPTSSPKWAQTKENAAKGAAAMLAVWGLPISAEVQHWAWYGKNCPTRLRRSGWVEFVQETDKHRKQLLAPAPDGPIYFPETGHYVKGGFKQAWLEHGLKVMGYPIGEEFGSGEFRKQEFQNVRLRQGPDGVVWFDSVVVELNECKKAHP